MKTAYLTPAPPTDRAAALRSGVRIALEDGRVAQARAYVRFAERYATVDADTLRAVEREIEEKR